MIAYLTILITTVNFVVSVEVNFYPKYRNYYSLFNDKGEIKDILQAGNEMRKVLNMELKYTALKQLLTTAMIRLTILRKMWTSFTKLRCLWMV